MTLQQISYALTIAEEGSMNSAAEKLFIAQPTLTVAIRTLEEELCIRLFNRSPHGVSVTDEAKQIYGHYEDLKNSMARNAG